MSGRHWQLPCLIMPMLKGVYICNNYVSITKEFNYNWPDIMLVLKEFIKQYIADDKPILKKRDLKKPYKP